MSFDFLKSKKFFILIFILVLGAGGFFYWQRHRPTPPEKWDTAKVSKRENYKIIEKDDGLLVKNEKAGLSLKLPKGWEFEKNFSTSSGAGGVSFAGPNMITATRTAVLQEGCRFKVGVAEIKTDIKTLRKEMPERFSTYPNVILEQQEEIEVQDEVAVKHIFRDEKYKMNYITVHIPKGDEVYEIFLDAAIEDKKKCKRQFKKILDTVSIK